jgi:ACS family hexuronate transporter-like MFS transporter
VGHILLSRRFWALAMLIFGAQTCWHLFRVWLPKFMQEGRGYSETEALAFNSAYYIGTDIGCIAAGIISLWLARRFAISAHGARRWVYAGACVMTSFSVLVLWLPKGWPLMGAILVVGAGALALFPATTVLCRSFPTGMWAGSRVCSAPGCGRCHRRCTSLRPIGR